MKKVYVAFICMMLFLIGCNNSVSNEPIIEKEQVYDFILSIKTDKSVYEKGNTINISSNFQYAGEEIKFDDTFKIYMVIKSKEDGSIVKQVEFNDIQKTMEKGDEFSPSIKDLRLPKGDYQLFAGTSPFSVGPANYLINTDPIDFKVKEFN
ncbi:hypothetical protein GWK91_14720 [Virgibacillus sp. MSP4-1]|uniref:hypothetical protein n=1 Tax=Virgibacillus sp. MSP4-1 TaxID=2700081 RepID=UPI0003A2D4F8|nr:hypothetical protein [Virgibacillus sp. MSP4-1]QHS24092.1 hypothetical protein GWK91_14720 [Virgibacillus sp. MSP4-1]